MQKIDYRTTLYFKAQQVFLLFLVLGLPQPKRLTSMKKRPSSPIFLTYRLTSLPWIFSHSASADPSLARLGESQSGMFLWPQPELFSGLNWRSNSGDPSLFPIGLLPQPIITSQNVFGQVCLLQLRKAFCLYHPRCPFREDR